MRIYNGEDRQERRRKHYITPIIFLLAELTIVWLILSIIMVDFNITKWNIFAKVSLLIFGIFFLGKTFKIYARQKNYKREK